MTVVVGQTMFPVGVAKRMFGQPAPTGLDVRFSVMGIPIRIHPIFWLTAGFLAWNPNDPQQVLVRIGCILLAVLVHELGHAVVTRRFGWRPEIVLYFFGGYATSQRYSTWKDIAVSAAGPAAGFLLYTMFWIASVAMIINGVQQERVISELYQHYEKSSVQAFQADWEAVQIGGEHYRGAWWAASDSRVHAKLFDLARSSIVYDAVKFSLFINLVWNLMNLVPVLPLDGGRISQELCFWMSPRAGLLASIRISVAASGAVAAWAGYCLYTKQGLLGLDPKFLAFMFGYLTYQGVQQLQAIQRGYRR